MIGAYAAKEKNEKLETFEYNPHSAGNGMSKNT